MRVAIAHDYLVNRGGAERVVLALHRIWPEAPIFTAIHHPDATYPEFDDADVRTSFLQRTSKRPEGFRRFLPLFPRAFRSLDIEGFDVVISSSAGFAHHVRPGDAHHVVYCHTPPRFLWDRYDRSIAPRWARPALPAMLRALRRADRRAAARAHAYVANSRRTATRIAAVYGRRSSVVYPPVETARFARPGGRGDHYLFVGRLLAHRNAELAVRAFSMLGKRLVIVGDGPVREDLQRIAGPTVEFRGCVPDAELEELVSGCRALVVPGEEDFGIAPLEAHAAGRPVVALGRGGVLESVRDGVNGVLFGEPTIPALVQAVHRVERMRFDPSALRTNADRFGEAVFAARMRALVESAQDCIGCARARRGSARPKRKPALVPMAPVAEEA